MHMTHDEYLTEPALMTEWFQKFEELGNEK